PNLQAIRHSSTSAVDVKAQLALWIFRREIDFARGSVKSLCYHNKMMDQLFHLGHDPRFGRHHVFPVSNVDGAVRQFIYYLTQNPNTLAHFLDSHQIAIVTITSTADYHVKIVLVVVEIGMFAA